MRDMPKEYTVKEIAERFGVNKMMVIRWCRAGLFPNSRRKNPFAAYNSPILIPEKDVEKFALKFEKAQK
jgi:predicted site-specific integrase-resolvase